MSSIAVPQSASPPREVPNFDGLASLYRWMEWLSFGPWLWWCRCAHLDSMQHARRALVLGDGDGRFTARLLSVAPEVRVDAVDGSEAMLRALLARAGTMSRRVRAEAADLRQWSPDPGEAYDLVVTHFCLDCLTTTEVEQLAMRVREAVTPRAQWVVSEFAIPEGWFGRLIAAPLVALLYWAFGWLTGLRVRHLPDHRTALRRAGFRLRSQRRLLWGLLTSERWESAGTWR